MVAFQNPIVYYLTIPSGATSGERIVIDGINGVIDVYNSANVLIAQIGNGAGLTLNSGTYTMQLSINSGLPEIVYWADATPSLTGGIVLDASTGAISMSCFPISNTVVPADSPLIPTVVLQQTGITMGYVAPADPFGAAFINAGMVITQEDVTFQVVSTALGFSAYQVTLELAAGGGASGPPVGPAWVVQDGGWLALILENGWTNAGSGYTPAARLMSNGVVYFRGALGAGTITVGTTIAFLNRSQSQAFPPAVPELVTFGLVGSTVVFVQVNVQTNGTLTLGQTVSGLTYMGLDPLSYPVI